MQFSAQQIAFIINAAIEGNPNATVHSFAKIEEAQTNDLAFLANPKYEDYLYTTAASVIIVQDTLQLKKPITATLLRTKEPYVAFATLLTKYQEMQTQQLQGIQQPSFISNTATIGNNVFIAAFSYIGNQVNIGNDVKIFAGVSIGNNVQIGNNVILHAGVKIYNDCVLGNNIIIHAGTVIGSDGFGFAPLADGSYKKVPQVGNVLIEDDVEIGANTTIDRATMGSTIIKSGVKLDNLVQIAHNVEVGGHTVIAAQAGVSGSTKIGTNVMIGGQAGIAGHIHIANGSKINGQSGVTKAIKTAKVVTGTPASEFNSALRNQAFVKKLPELEKRVKELEALVEQLTKKLV